MNWLFESTRLSHWKGTRVPRREINRRKKRFDLPSPGLWSNKRKMALNCGIDVDFAVWLWRSIIESIAITKLWLGSYQRPLRVRNDPEWYRSHENSTVYFWAQLQGSGIWGLTQESCSEGWWTKGLSAYTSLSLVPETCDKKAVPTIFKSRAEIIQWLGCLPVWPTQAWSSVPHMVPPGVILKCNVRSNSWTLPTVTQKSRKQNR